MFSCPAQEPEVLTEKGDGTLLGTLCLFQSRTTLILQIVGMDRQFVSEGSQQSREVLLQHQRMLEQHWG